MKNFKILFGSLVIILATVLVYSCNKENENPTIDFKTLVQSRGGDVPLTIGGDLLDLLGTACVPSSIVIPGACNDTIYTDTVVITNHSMYPGCSFKVIFKRQECKIPSFKDVTVGDFQILDHDCPQFSIDLDNNYNQSIWSSYIIDFETEMWNNIRDHIIAQNVVGNDYICMQGVFFYINFIRASCYRYVSTIRKHGGLGISTKLACGSQCCERHTRVCRNTDGTLNIVQSDVTNPFTISCSDPSFLMDPPIWLGKVEWITPCKVTCPN